MVACAAVGQAMGAVAIVEVGQMGVEGLVGKVGLMEVTRAVVGGSTV